MSSDCFSNLTRRVCAFIGGHANALCEPAESVAGDTFRQLALDLFAAQFAAVTPYREFCEARGATPDRIADWHDIPAVPTTAFKELEFTSLAPAERTAVFHSSGTTRQPPSRHFHNAESLALYEASLRPWFERHLLPDRVSLASGRLRFLVLTPPAPEAPHSSLAQMFRCVVAAFGRADSAFAGAVTDGGGWVLDCEAAATVLAEVERAGEPLGVLGTAFSFVHLLDHLEVAGRRFALPTGSRVLETGGYKGRSRTLPKAELHALITRRLGVPAEWIVCEYGMSELSSQGYDGVTGVTAPRVFRFPPWARAVVVSPETGREVGEGEAGLLRVFDLANVCSVLAIQTEDVAVRRSEGFELLGRAELAEPRGCSLMSGPETVSP